jgi:CO/xanthine dehydrogenase FAD-binding subunit
MKPAPFEYVRPTSVDEVCAILAADEDARVIAGGQTLVPMLAMRLARPTTLVDIARLPELRGIVDEGDAIRVGAVTRQVEAEHDPLVAAKIPLLVRALHWVGHPPTRNRGTIGGSIANADPSAEIPLTAVTLGATFHFQAADGSSEMPADEFFLGAMATAIAPGACLTHIRFPVWTDQCIGTSFHEISARRSDYAFVSVAAQVALGADGRCSRIALGVGGVGDRPVRIAAVDALVGGLLNEADIRDVIADELATLEPSSDLQASAAYRRRVATLLTQRASSDARAQAAGVRV